MFYNNVSCLKITWNANCYVILSHHIHSTSLIALMYMYVIVCYKHVLEDTDCYGGYLNKSCILYLVSCTSIIHLQRLKFTA